MRGWLAPPDPLWQLTAGSSRRLARLVLGVAEQSSKTVSGSRQGPWRLNGSTADPIPFDAFCQPKQSTRPAYVQKKGLSRATPLRTEQQAIVGRASM